MSQRGYTPSGFPYEYWGDGEDDDDPLPHANMYVLSEDFDREDQVMRDKVFLKAAYHVDLVFVCTETNAHRAAREKSWEGSEIERWTPWEIEDMDGLEWELEQCRRCKSALLSVWLSLGASHPTCLGHQLRSKRHALLGRVRKRLGQRLYRLDEQEMEIENKLDPVIEP